MNDRDKRKVVTVGTIGNVDHGKATLAAALLAGYLSLNKTNKPTK